MSTTTSTAADRTATNVETVGAIYEAFGRGDVPAIVDLLATDVRWEDWADNRAQAADVPWMRARHGRDEVYGFFAEAGKLEITDFQVLDLLASEHQVVAEVVIEANVPATGGSYRDEELHLWTFDADGKVTRLRHYTDTAKHIAAATPAT
jgi:ketosteroid isomerase-like protein